MTHVSQATREGDLINIDGEEIRYHRIDNDVNGNPRYVVHFLALGIKLEDYGKTSLTRVLNCKPYRAKWYGGGYVFQSYNIESDIRFAIEAVKKYYA